MNPSLHEGVVEAAPLAVRRLRGHGVGPLDGEGVDGARDEHEGGEAEVEPVHLEECCALLGEEEETDAVCLVLVTRILQR